MHYFPCNVSDSSANTMIGVNEYQNKLSTSYDRPASSSGSPNNRTLLFTTSESRINSEMDQARGNGNVAYSGVKYHQEVDHGRANTSGNYVAVSSKYQTGISRTTEMERAHAKYQIEMEMARQKYQAEIEQAATKYQNEIEQARGNVGGTFSGMKTYQQVTPEDMDKVREQDANFKYQNVELEHVGQRSNNSNNYTEVKYHSDLQQQTTNIPVGNSYSNLDYQSATTTPPAPAPAPTKKRKKKDENKIRKRCAYQRRLWTQEEREAVMRQLGDFFTNARLPGKKDIEEALQREDVLALRSWKNIKDFIRNKTSPPLPRRPLPTQIQPLPTQVPVHEPTTSTMINCGNMAGMHTGLTDSKSSMLSHHQQQQQHHHHHQQQQQQQQQQMGHQQQHQQPEQQPQGSKKRKKKSNPESKSRRVISRRDWSGAEKAAVLHYFGDYVARQKLPGKKEIEECIQKEDILCYRSWRNVKDFIRNTAQAQVKREAIFGPNPEFSLLS